MTFMMVMMPASAFHFFLMMVMMSASALHFILMMMVSASALHLILMMMLSAGLPSLMGGIGGAPFSFLAVAVVPVGFPTGHQPSPEHRGEQRR